MEAAARISDDVAAARAVAASWRQARHDLRQATQDHAFVLLFQPRFGLLGGGLCGVQAQLRWPRRRGGRAPAGAFVPLLQECGVADDVTAWSLAAACRAARAWPGLPVCLAVPGASLRGGRLLAQVGTALAESGLPAEHLQLEFSEGQLSERQTHDSKWGDGKWGDGKWSDRQLGERQSGDRQWSDRKWSERQTGEHQSGECKSGDRPFGDGQLTGVALSMADDEALITLAALRDCGVGVALDEFGSASACLLTLKRLPLTAVKLDRSLVRDLPADRDTASVAAAAIGLAHALGVVAVATGLETEAQRAALRRMSCDQAQGALCGRVMDEADFLEYVEKHEPGEPRGSPPDTSAFFYGAGSA